MPTQQITSLDDKISFGKYQGKTINQIMQEDIAYAKWLTTAWNIIGIASDVRDKIKNFASVTT